MREKMINRKDIEKMIEKEGLVTLEQRLGIVVMGVRSRCWDKDVIVEIGEDMEREK